MNLLILKLSKLSTHQELLSDLSIYLTVLHMIGRSKMNQWLNDMTPNRMLLDAVKFYDERPGQGGKSSYGLSSLALVRSCLIRDMNTDNPQNKEFSD